MPTLDTGGEVNFRKGVFSFSSTKDGQYSPLFDFATGIEKSFLLLPPIATKCDHLLQTVSRSALLNV
jgi:hypothetical protein